MSRQRSASGLPHVEAKTFDPRRTDLYVGARTWMVQFDLHPAPDDYLGHGYVELCLRAWPTAAGAPLHLAAQWALLVWLLDDELDQEPLGAAPDVVDRLVLALLDAAAGASRPRPTITLSSRRWRIWSQRTREMMPGFWWGRYRRQLAAWIRAANEKLVDYVRSRADADPARVPAAAADRRRDAARRDVVRTRRAVRHARLEHPAGTGPAALVLRLRLPRERSRGRPRGHVHRGRRAGPHRRTVGPGRRGARPRAAAGTGVGLLVGAHRAAGSAKVRRRSRQDGPRDGPLRQYPRPLPGRAVRVDGGELPVRAGSPGGGLAVARAGRRGSAPRRPHCLGALATPRTPVSAAHGKGAADTGPRSHWSLGHRRPDRPSGPTLALGQQLPEPGPPRWKEVRVVRPAL